ncbi:protein-L-isoaspartate O-methyltransferase family protein [Mesorhizobium marinum]|uniref:protein-L-isoaspartate O-methyltransferase family protein n=1 Tax=Mesorhizobium marinum TaxID=3228790 RepID=UPI0034650E14
MTRSDDHRLTEARSHYGRMMAEASGSPDPRIGRVFETLAREDFLPPAPWRILGAHRYEEVPASDAAQLYRNVLVAIDAERGINNGEPFLHAQWIGAVAPQPGESVVHVGAGGGYYTAALALLIEPGGFVVAYEIDPQLAVMAGRNLAPYANVSLRGADAVTAALDEADILYVNAGVVAPPLAWLRALKPGGRMIFPWRPAREIGLTVLVTRAPGGYVMRIVGGSWFIPCVGASDARLCLKTPMPRDAQSARSIVPAADRAPDETAVAIYPEIWFSSAAIGVVEPTSDN